MPWSLCTVTDLFTSRGAAGDGGIGGGGGGGGGTSTTSCWGVIGINRESALGSRHDECLEVRKLKKLLNSRRMRLDVIAAEERC